MSHEGPHARRSRWFGGDWKWQGAVFAVAIVAGASFVAVRVTADGTDLRPAGGDISSVINDRSRVVKAREEQAANLQSDIDGLSNQTSSASLKAKRDQVDNLEAPAGFTQIKGAGMRVTLTDAPTSVSADGIDPNLLVVHQQDIQAFVNALWAGGAQAVTLQGRRLISTTGIRCVGNTVVLDGVPYSPPYVIEAVGKPSALQAALDSSSDVVIYRQWAQRFHLGLTESTKATVVAPGYQGSVDMQYAKVAASG
jgi:uncharacterized protein YlxW (UPF0749 family)